MAQLHFVRLRHKDSQDPFCDPMADIKNVVQQAFIDGPLLFKNILSEEQIDYLRAYLKVFQTRLAEDKTPLAVQMKIFMKAMKSKFSKRELDMMLKIFAQYILCIYAMHERRDGAVDAAYRSKFRAAGGLLTLLGSLSEDTRNKVLKEFNESLYLNSEDAKGGVVDAVCFEDKARTIADIKDLAASSMGATGDQSWSAVAKACDEAVARTENTDKSVAFSLAYPDYDTPYFEVTVDDA